MTLHTRILVFLIALLFGGFITMGWYMEQLAKQDQLTHATRTARDLDAALMAMRRVYHQQFIDSGIALTDKTVGFLPAHALARISQDFPNWSDSGVHFNAVSDRPRNPGNQADAKELEAMAWFRGHPGQKERVVRVQDQTDGNYYHYSQPVWIEPYCLKCHGKKADAPPSIAAAYDTAYDYQVGDLRGLMSIRIPEANVIRAATSGAVPYVAFIGAALLVGALILYLLLRHHVFLRLQQITSGIRRIRDGDFQAPIAIKRDDELGQIANALNEMSDQRGHYEQRLREERNLYRILSETNQLIVRQEASQTLFEDICRIAISDTDLILAEIHVWHDDSAVLERKAADGLTGVVDADGVALLKSVADTHQEAVINDCNAQGEARFPSGVGCTASLPLCVDGTFIGVFSCYAAQAGYFNDRVMALLREMSSDLAFAVQNRQRNEHLQASQNQLSYLAQYDVLTGKPNRAFFQKLLDQAVFRARRYDYRGAVLHLDLQDFHLVIESLGQDVANTLLCEIADDLALRLRKEDSLARLGGDEFLILLDRVGKQPDDAATEALHVARGLQEVISTPRQADQQALRMSCSVGMVLFPTTGQQTSAEILRRAATALHEVKVEAPGTIRLFQASMESSASQRLRLRHELRNASTEEQFRLVYQPQVSLESASPAGAEVLLRWQHPNGRLLTPVHFIDELENSEQVVSVGQWVLNKACAQLGRWVKSGIWPKDSRLSVNLSAKQIMLKGCVEKLDGIVAQNHISPSLLELEITESTLLEMTETITARLQELRSRGYSISIDDFGTGYSSLAYLRQLPADVLKIDIAFVREVATDTNARSVANIIRTFAREFDLHTIAEGVEHISQHQVLREVGVDLVQGFLYAKPMMAEDFENWLIQETGKRATHPANRWVSMPTGTVV